MAKHLIYRLISMSCVVFLLLLTGCERCQPTLEGKQVNLEPDDPRPVLSLQVADADEASLLVQKLGIEVVRMDGLTVYFFEDATKVSKLAELGYDLRKQNSYDVFRRVVRIDRSVPEAELVATGVRIINREKKYLIVDATIGQLRALVRGGAQIAAISELEPRPRQIRIVVGSREDVARINATGVDIYNAKPERKKPSESQQAERKISIVIYGGALDYQIDKLKEMGYSVEILPEPQPGK